MEAITVVWYNGDWKLSTVANTASGWFRRDVVFNESDGVLKASSVM